MVTVALISVVLAAGYVIAILILLIEGCVHGNVFKYWLREKILMTPKTEN
jgi:hypothetical protein